jgi:hypothetical protein
MKATKSRRTAAAANAPASPPQGLQLWHWAVGCIIALIAVFTVYGPALEGPFLLDDSYLPYALPAYAIEPVTRWMAGMRPVLMLTYWMNFQSGGDAVFGYHFVNVMLHAANGILVFLIVRKVLGWAQYEEWGSEVLSAFCAALFLVHPLQTESVAYIASRSETLSVFFFLAAYAVFVYRRSTAVTWAIVTAILVLFGLGCLTKEHAVVLPVLLLLTDYFWNPGFTLQGARRNWKLYVPIVVVGAAAGAMVWRVLQTATTAGFALKDLTWYQYFFTQCRAIWSYVLFFVLPVGQNIDHDFAVSKTVFDHGAIVGLVGLIALLGAAWYFRRKYPLICYGVFTFLLLFAPTSSVVPLRDTLVERRMYLPFIGFLFVTAGVLRFWKPSRSTLVVTLSVVLLAESVLAYHRNELWGNSIAMWTDSVEKSPGKRRPHFQLAYAYYGAQRCKEAVDEFSRTGQIEKPDSSLLIDWALAADCAGNGNEALVKLQQAATIDKTAHVYSQIGMEFAKAAQYPQALDALDTAEKLDPKFTMTYVYRGNVYALQGNRQRAAAEYQHALEIDPRNTPAREALLRLAR